MILSRDFAFWVQNQAIVGYLSLQVRLDYQTLTTGWYSRNRVRTSNRLQVGVILIGKGLLGSSIHLSTSTGKLVVVDLDLRGSEGGLSNELL